MREGLFLIHHSSIGKSTQASSYTAAAHIRYASRDQKGLDAVAGNIPATRTAQQNYLKSREDRIRSNGRVIDKIMICLPRSLPPKARIELTKEFMNEVTLGNKVVWGTWLHDNYENSSNPHCHAWFTDEGINDPKQRVLFASDSPKQRQVRGLPAGEDSGKKSYKLTSWIRDVAERVINKHLQMHGVDEKVNRNTLEHQEYDPDVRKPTIHVGPEARFLHHNVGIPASKTRNIRRWGKRQEIDYQDIDAGTRVEYNNRIIDFNLEKAARSSDFPTRSRAELERKLRPTEQRIEEELIYAARRITRVERDIRKEARFQIDDIRKKADTDRIIQKQNISRQFTPKILELEEQHRRQKRWWVRTLSIADVTNTLSRRRKATEKELTETRQHRKDAEAQALEKIRTRELARLARIKTSRDHRIQELHTRNKEKLSAAQDQRQHD